MPIDASIPLRVQAPQPIQVPNAAEEYSRAMQLKGMLMQQQAQERALQDEQAQREAFRQSGGDMSRLKSLLQGQGNLRAYQDIVKQEGESDYKKAQTNQANAHADSYKADALNKTIAAHRDQLANVNSPQDAAQWLAYGFNDKTMGPLLSQGGKMDLQTAISRIPTDPMMFQNWKAQAAMGATKFMERNTLTAADKQQAETARRGQDITAATTRRGQDMTDAREKEKNQLARESKPLTDAQSKAALFGSRMQSADEVINSLASSGKQFSTPGARTGFGVGAVVNALNSSQGQQLDQAKRDFINAVLRRESGAVISDSEFDNAEKQYFPQIGDAPEVIRQKANNRSVAIRGVQAEVPDNKRGVIDEIRGTKTKSGASVSNW